MMIDKTVHWDPVIQTRRMEFLDSLPDDQRDFMAFTIRTSNAVLHYYREHEAEPTKEDFEEWLTILPEVMADSFRKEGYEKSKGALPLRRHTAERKDLGLNEYMREALSSEDYIRWIGASTEL